MLSVLRNRNYALLWVGQLGSIFGDFVLFIALPFFVYDLTGSAAATGGMFIAQTLPRVFLSSIAGVLVDRWDRRVVMIVADVVRGCTFLLIFAVRSPEMLPLLYGVAFVNAGFGRLFQPAKNALIPHLVPADELTAANALDSLSTNISRLVAPALGGIWYAAFGLPPVLTIDIASFFFSAALLALIAVPNGGRAGRTDTAPLSAKTVLRDLREGLGVARRSAIIAAIFLAIALSSITEGMLSVLFVPFTREIIGGGAEAFGFLVGIQAVGGITGGVLVGRTRGGSPSPWAMGCGVLGDAVCLLGCVVLPGRVPLPPLVIASGLLIIAGGALIAYRVGIEVLLQRTVGDAFRGRVFGVYYTLIALFMLIGQGIASVIVAPLGVAWAFALAPLGECVAAIALFTLLRRAMRDVSTPAAITVGD